MQETLWSNSAVNWVSSMTPPGVSGATPQVACASSSVDPPGRQLDNPFRLLVESRPSPMMWFHWARVEYSPTPREPIDVKWSVIPSRTAAFRVPPPSVWSQLLASSTSSHHMYCSGWLMPRLVASSYARSHPYWYAHAPEFEPSQV